MAYEMGDLVVLVSGSMRMAVEGVDGENIAVVWCNEGEIGRDVFNARLLKKWEMREDTGDRPKRPFKPRDDVDGDRPKRPYKPRDDADGDRPKRPYKPREESDGPPKPRAKTGWDGKPREKKFFRKDD